MPDSYQDKLHQEYLGGLFHLILLVLGILGVFGLLWLYSSFTSGTHETVESRRLDRDRKRRLAYEASLDRLRTDPNNAEYREQALNLGRLYFSTARINQELTVLDEVSLKNDIDAACAGAVKSPPIQKIGPSIQERLTNLDNLLSKGMISSDEHDLQRKRILDSI